MGAVPSIIHSTYDCLKDFRKCAEFSEKFFNDEHKLSLLALTFMAHSDPSLWSLVLVLSKKFRRFFGDAHQRSMIAQEDMQYMYQYLIIDPINKMQWLSKIDEVIKNYPITNQGGFGICWSHAIATVIYLSQSRIVGRHVDEFLTIKQRLLDEFGYGGQNEVQVMNRVLPRYKLHYKKVSPSDLHGIIRNGRVCVAGFVLNGVQWYNFSKFFMDPKNKKRAITSFDINRTPSYEELRGVELESGGHAVVLTDVSLTEWTFLNSWGEEWGDKGLFRVQPGAFRITFYDVFWYESDLSNHEKLLFQERGRESLEIFYKIVEEIDPLLIEKKKFLYDLEKNITFILQTCSKIVRNSLEQSIPKLNEVSEIISPIESTSEGQIQILIKDDRSVVVNGVHITATQIDLLISFLACYFVIGEVSDQLKEMSDNFWRDA